MGPISRDVASGRLASARGRLQALLGDPALAARVLEAFVEDELAVRSALERSGMHERVEREVDELVARTRAEVRARNARNDV